MDRVTEHAHCIEDSRDRMKEFGRPEQGMNIGSGVDASAFRQPANDGRQRLACASIPRHESPKGGFPRL